MPAKVVDASVIAALCFGEPRAREAAALLRETEMHAPFLLAYELTGIARKNAESYPDKAAAVEEGLRTGLALRIHWSDVDHPAVMRLALSADLSAYDASYLYLARQSGIPLVTFDERLKKRAGLADRR